MEDVKSPDDLASETNVHGKSAVFWCIVCHSFYCCIWNVFTAYLGLINPNILALFKGNF